VPLTFWSSTEIENERSDTSRIQQKKSLVLRGILSVGKIFFKRAFWVLSHGHVTERSTPSGVLSRVQVSDVLILPIMDYSRGILEAMCSPFFPDLRRNLGPYLVDKTKLIENIVVNRRLTGNVDLVLRPRRCGKSTMLQMLK